MQKIVFRFKALLSLYLVVFSIGLCSVHAQDNIEVDVELVLAVDVSRSMTGFELEIQRRGYAEALVSAPVVQAIQDGLLGRIALTYIEWGGSQWQRTIIDWTLIENREDVEMFAARLTAQFDGSLRRTSISGIIDHASGQFDSNGFTARRQIIDISGDGPNNQGRPVQEARDQALLKGITINGLPLMTRQGLGMQFHLDDLDDYYTNCVIGGPGSFVIPVVEWDGFAEAVRRKLQLELARNSPMSRQWPIHKVAFTGAQENGYDCLIGEKIWQYFMEQYPLLERSP